MLATKEDSRYLGIIIIQADKKKSTRAKAETEQGSGECSPPRVSKGHARLVQATCKVSRIGEIFGFVFASHITRETILAVYARNTPR